MTVGTFSSEIESSSYLASHPLQYRFWLQLLLAVSDFHSTYVIQDGRPPCSHLCSHWVGAFTVVGERLYSDSTDRG